MEIGKVEKHLRANQNILRCLPHQYNFLAALVFIIGHLDMIFLFSPQYDFFYCQPGHDDCLNRSEDCNSQRHLQSVSWAIDLV